MNSLRLRNYKKKLMKKYVVITWPESQELCEKKGFEENCYLIADEQGLNEFGSGAYFVNEEWLFNN
jgi:hypothetical protein